MKQQLPEILAQASTRRILCVGDLMLDRFVYGAVDRISPESPVPVLRKTHTVEMLGGAGNVARNMAAMGLKVIMAGLVGEDDSGRRLVELLDENDRIETRIVSTAQFQTVVKSRFVARNQQLLRVDSEQANPSLDAPAKKLVELIEKAAPDCDAIVVSDYAKGAINPDVFAACRNAASRHSIPLLVDPKSRDFSIYAGATLIKPNASELAAATSLPCTADEDIEAALDAASNKVEGASIVVTRAGRGMSWLEEGHVSHKRGEARQVFDVSGAGDTSMAALALGLASGASLEQSVSLAVTASGIAVSKTGTATVDADEIIAALRTGQIDRTGVVLGRDALIDQVQKWKSAGLRVGFTNGCFDILHTGHLSLLETSRENCDRLVVAINTDASVRRLKGDERPINSEADRARLLAGMTVVDAVTNFDEDTPAELIASLIPDVLIKGGDYSIETIVGADVVRSAGGEVLIVPLVPGQSTTGIIERSRR
ncbi:D-glycero-beta-D-manno-heptose 1-phosphate adenylyltransferase [Henriciella litoralis]|uniref:D-glycero-beta-D-manno-heptose 1-phosphate adenylyltransferase n=1 Tax=Henriciella litoralis TaxID=568102 RepID=UPI000A07437A|nr:D-glycero-beta-D-manno-heptose 1-phosphate adenylyltransferase [Henriciella litoralis]